ncbi:MAG: DUF1501 domain-containing protein, partial [Verrucomicrobiota bacterium]
MILFQVVVAVPGLTGAVPELDETDAAFDVGRESKKTRAMYGDTPLGRQVLSARRLAERGVRFIQLW